MSFDYANHQLYINHHTIASKSPEFVQAAVTYNMAADALVLCGARLKIEMDGSTFMEDFVSVCFDYFDAVEDGDEEASQPIAYSVLSLVKREYPAVAEMAEFKLYFLRFQEAVKGFVQAQKNEKSIAIKESTR